jgi:DNA-binding GntR family transcriptional regulator
MALTRAEPSLLTDRVYAAIYEAIINGKLPAGTHLKVREVAAEVGTSVMPVREAIRRLEDAGLIEHIPHRGAAVKTLTIEELEHLYDVRILLEVDAARRGAASITPSDSARLRPEHAEMARAVEQGRLLDALKHHEAILTLMYDAGDNPVQMDLIRGLWLRSRAYAIRGARRAQQLSDTNFWWFQLRLIRAVEAHDATAAAEITREWLNTAKSGIRATLDAAT